jgi:hypothetical protein
MWFNPERWSQYDLAIAVASIVLAVSLFTPWFRAIVHLRNYAATGFLIRPTGTQNGVTAHSYLWVVLALAIAQFVVLAARYVPRGRGYTLPGYRRLLIALSSLSAIAVAVAFVTKPHAWYGHLIFPPFMSVAVGWGYGAAVAIGAAIISLGFAIAAVRDDPSSTRPVTSHWPR